MITGLFPAKLDGGRYINPEIDTPSKLFQRISSGSLKPAGSTPICPVVHLSRALSFTRTEKTSAGLLLDSNPNPISEESLLQIRPLATPGWRSGRGRSLDVARSIMGNPPIP